MNNKTLAMLSYVTIIGWLIAFFVKREETDAFRKYHLKQGLGLFITMVIQPLNNDNRKNFSLADLFSRCGLSTYFSFSNHRNPHCFQRRKKALTPYWKVL